MPEKPNRLYEAEAIFATSAHCYGREPELLTLRNLFAKVRNTKRGAVAWITGPEGIGKTCFANEARQRLNAEGAIVLESPTRSLGRPHEAIVHILREATQALGNDPKRVNFPARAMEVVATFEDLSTKPLPQQELAEAGRIAIYERTAQLLAEVAAQRSLVMLFDDFHLVDTGTRAFINYWLQTRFTAPGLSFAEEVALLPALLVVTSPTADSALLPQQVNEHISLGSLGEEGIRDFLQSPELVARLSAVTGGNPHALEALFGTRPVSSNEAYLSRIEGLSREAAQMLAALAVYGRPASLERLGRIVLLSPSKLAHAASELTHAKVLNFLESPDGKQLSFIRGSDEERVHRELPEAERTRLHTMIGELLLASGEVIEMVLAAEHLLRGRPGKLAINIALQAGAQLESGFEYSRAIAIYRQALAAAPTTEVETLITQRLIRLEQQIGDYASALEDAERLRRRMPLDPTIYRLMGELHVLRDDYVNAATLLSHAHLLAEGNPRVQAEVSMVRGELCFLRGEHEQAKAACEQAMARANGVDFESIKLRLATRNTLGKVLLAQGKYPEAGLVFSANFNEAHAAGSSHEESRALYNRGIVYLRQGDNGQAAHCYQEALKVADAAEDHRNRAFCLQNLGILAFWRCDYVTALSYLHESVRAFKRIGHRPRLSWLALDLASLYLDLGAMEQALAMNQLALQLDDNGNSAAVNINRAIIEGVIAGRQNNPQAARIHFAQARALAKQTDNCERFVEATLAQAQFELEAGKVEALPALLEEISGTAAQGNRARLMLLQGEWALSQGSIVEAQRFFTGAMEQFHLLGNLAGEWRTQFALGKLAARERDFDDARRRFLAVGELWKQLQERVPEELQGFLVQDPVYQSWMAEKAQLLKVFEGGKTTSTLTPDATVDTKTDSYQRIVGRHPLLKEVFSLVDKVAAHDTLVLLRGESGTGKELVANAIQNLSPRAGRPFIKVNCGALIETLLLSELFGHERGAFTGALQRRKGHFECADGGTIFLDEIGDISPKTQVALLRFLQEREFERIGSTTPIKVDVRIICATNRDLEAMVESGRLRHDLYYRLKGIEIVLPPLRERMEDLPLLADHFLSRIADERHAPRKSMSSDALAVLAQHSWPGNVRELENVLRSVSLLCEGNIIRSRDVVAHSDILRDRAYTGQAAPENMAPGSQGGAWEQLETEGIGLRELQQRIEVECIRRALDESKGNITKAAGMLKMKRSRLSQLIKEYGITTSTCEEKRS